MAEFAQTDLPAPGIMAVDWEQRVDFERMRDYKMARIRQTLDDHDLGGLLLFKTSNIRYLTNTHIGYWAFNKLERWALTRATDRPTSGTSAPPRRRTGCNARGLTRITRSAATPACRARSAAAPACPSAPPGR